MPKGISKHPEETRQKRSEALRGRTFSPEHCRRLSENQRQRMQDPEYRAKVYTAERARKLSEALRGRPKTPEHRAKLSLSTLANPIRMIGDTNPARRPDVKVKMAKAQQQRYLGHKLQSQCSMCGCRFDQYLSDKLRGRLYCSEACARKKHRQNFLNPQFKEQVVRRLRARASCRPNKAEIRLQHILDKCSPNKWQYNGQGRLVIGGFAPDFVNVDGKKALIELFGDYWHTVGARRWDQTELGRIMAYNSLGFRCLVIWEHELDNETMVKNKVAHFFKGGKG